MSNVGDERCVPCKEAGFPNILAHYKGVPAGKTHNGKTQHPMCWDHYHKKEPKHILSQTLSELVAEKPEVEGKHMPSKIETSRSTVMTTEDKVLSPNCSSMEIASKGIRTSQDFARLMSAVMSDLISGKITADTAKAVCTAGDRLLRVVELQLKLTKPGETLKLTE